MKAPSNGYRIVQVPNGDWAVIDQPDPLNGKVIGYYKTYRGARTAHYRLSVERATGKPVSYAQARKAGNA